MRSFEFETWDGGHLTVNREWADVFRSNGLTTFESLMEYNGGTVAKNVLRERTTTRFVLPARDGSSQAFYIKRHGKPPWKEYIKPFFRLTLPILGARNEWNAILHFHELGIPTMIPVCLGDDGRTSFLVTHSLEGFQKLSEWMAAQVAAPDIDGNADKVRQVVTRVAEIARTMHAAGLHHQDFYLGHLLLPLDESVDGIHVIDLGRVRRKQRLGTRWIVKDLAQLDYSARFASNSDRKVFLDAYLGREATDCDRRLLGQISRKSQAIARHSRKNSL